jgi:cytochrome c oxidase assembly protein subunit 11
MNTTDKARRLRKTGLVCATVAVLMVGASFAAVPLYRLFCQVTGYGGTTQRAEQAPGKVLDREVTVRFDANVAPGLPWEFVAPKPVKLRLGETGIAHFTATNKFATANTGQALFNVTPEQTGQYFNKIACFCFSEQTLKAGETVDMPVTFFVDPALADDHELSYVDTITLSYTFFPQADKAKPVAAAAAGGAAVN